VEIAPVPHRATRGEWRRLALGALVLAPLVLLVILPATLGLSRYVVSDRAMDGWQGRGAVVLTQAVPPSDLRPGDVITLDRPGAGEEQITRRIVSIDPNGQARTKADNAAAPDPWVVPLTEPTYARFWVGVPWVAYPFVAYGGWVLLVPAVALALAVALSAGRKTQTPVVKPTRTGLPVG
jgi:signal peptidase